MIQPTDKFNQKMMEISASKAIENLAKSLLGLYDYVEVLYKHVKAEIEEDERDSDYVKLKSLEVEQKIKEEREKLAKAIDSIHKNIEVQSTDLPELNN